jgi:hypothetical protein
VDKKPASEIIREAIDAHLQQQPVNPEQEWFRAEEWQAAEREVEAELEAGHNETHGTMAEFLRSLD